MTFKHQFSTLKVLKGLFLIVGGGKFGKIALDYALSTGDSLVIVLDKLPFNEIFKETSFDDIRLIADLNHYYSIIKNYDHAQCTKSEAYFFQTDMDDISRYFISVIPEYTIPVIPSHYFANLFLDFLCKSILGNDLEDQQLKIYSGFIDFLKNSSDFDENKENPELKGSTHTERKFLQVLKKIPQEVILQSDPRIGIILLSYAKKEEICPNNCIGPVGFCPTFKRNKPFTIKQLIDKQIEYNNNSDCIGVCVESKQLKPGLGGIHGSDLQSGILTLFDGILEQLNKDINNQKIIVGTACNCHGVLNIIKTRVLIQFFKEINIEL